MKYFALACAGVASLVITGLAYSQATGVPHVFTAGTPARASEVNDNFNALDTRITAAETAIANANGMSGGTGFVLVDAMQNVIGNFVDLSAYNNSFDYGNVLVTLDIDGADERFVMNVYKNDSIFYFDAPSTYYTGANCTGSAYIYRQTNSIPLGLPVGVNNSTGQLFVSTVAADTTGISFMSQSSSFNGNCSTFSVSQNPSFSYYEVTDIIDIATLYPTPWSIALQ